MRRIGVLFALLTVASCGSAAAQPSGPTAANVALQPGDLPAGMVKCSLSGDIDTFLNQEKSSDAKTYQSVAADWKAYQKAGATAAYVAFYADSKDACAQLAKPSFDIGAAPFKLAIDFTVQYKDSKSAAAAYANGDAFEFNPADLAVGNQALQGSQTGLTPNSITLFASLPPHSYFIAVWQNKSFMVVLALLNVDSAASKHAALAENNRIR